MFLELLKLAGIKNKKVFGLIRLNTQKKKQRQSLGRMRGSLNAATLIRDMNTMVKKYQDFTYLGEYEDDKMPKSIGEFFRSLLGKDD